MNSRDKFSETKLPKKEDFYSQLYEEKNVDKDNTRANIVWKHFKIKKSVNIMIYT
jgi:predicted nucleic acid binding AN1-type Zn finger protein